MAKTRKMLDNIAQISTVFVVIFSVHSLPYLLYFVSFLFRAANLAK